MQDPVLRASGPKSPTPGDINIDPRHPRIMVETAFLASTSALLWILNFYFPIGPVFRMMFALPTAIAYLRWGKRAAWMTAIVASLLLGVLMGPPRSLLFLIPFGLLGVLLGGLWRAKKSWAYSFGWGVLLMNIGVVFQMIFASLLSGTNLWVYVNQQVRGLLGWGFEKLGLLIDPSLGAVQLVGIGLVTVQSLGYLLLVHLVALLLMQRLGHPIPDPPPWLAAMIDEG
jgi:uncharacterized protein YybS (DUF2232 family)